ncbi:MAG TPA: chromosomal replication initiator protein DnaA [Candidatus Atribacteria bacterium]|nr:chromosomal replication initiator protein DnaA [Candidatus Atribacteria bacterium]
MNFIEDNNLWDKILQTAKSKLPPQAYNSWFSQTKILKFKDNELIVAVPNDFCKEWLEKHYIEFIKDLLTNLLNLKEDINIKFKTSNLKPSKTIQENKTKQIKSKINNINNNIEFFLQPKYTFDTFVVGNGNRFAHAACLAVAQSPAKAYNPLFVYGGVGLGKTHLMQAIGNYILQNNLKKKINVLYISSEKFTNELINSIRDDRTGSFRNKYRSVDVLLIDDIQFLAGKERTQEEFFHTFNTLYDSNKQIVIASDRPPKEIPTLEDRLISRFEWGLITDIQPPDLETRIAILRKKAQLENLDIPSEVINFIADKIPSNIRQLEGALTKLIAFSTLTKNILSIPLAQEILKDIIPIENKEISINQIQKITADYFNIKLSALLSKKRTKNIVMARQVAIYLSRELTDFSLPAIGEIFGGKDHTTILHSYSKIKNKIEKDKSLKSVIENLTLKIKNE